MKNYILKIYKKNGEIEIVRTRKKKRFSKVIRTINFKNVIKKAYIKISYGKSICSSGCLCEFYNDGWTTNKSDLLLLFEYFRKEEKSS